MPKQIKSYQTFHGGLNTKTTEFDLKEGELVECRNWGAHEPGKIFTQGQPSTVANATTVSTIAPGYGLLPVSVDEVIHGSDTSKEYIFFGHKNGVVAAVGTETNPFDSERATGLAMDSAGSVTAAKPILTAESGVIRVSDSAKNATCRTKGIEYINKTQFQASSGEHNVVTAWVAGDRELVAPVSNAATNWIANGENVIDYRSSTKKYATTDGTYDPSVRVQLDIDATGSGGTWESTSYEFAMSYMYTGNQESLPTVMKIIDWSAGGSTPSEVSSLTLGTKNFWTGIQVTATHHVDYSWNKRIIGARVYIRKIAKNARWGLFLDVNFGENKSVRTSTFDLYSNSWTQETDDVKYYSTTAIDIKSPSPESYLSINGFNYDEPSGISFPAIDSFLYSAAAIVNKRMWVANAKYYDENGVTKTMGDRLFYTPPNKLDTFPPANYVDIGMNDGESFTGLAGFGNRLFCFKQHNLYIVNVAGALDSEWALEGNFKSMGILEQSHVVTTDIGLSWFNTSGCYFWGGEGSPKEITGGKITSADWDVTVNGTIGYDFVNKQIIVVKDATGTNKDAFSYDMRTQSWQRWKGYITTSCTNLITLPGSDSSMVHYDNTTLKKYVPTIGVSGTADDSVFKTKKDDLGSAIYKKKLYNLYFNVTTSGAMDLEISIYTDIDDVTVASFTSSGAEDGVLKRQSLSLSPCQWVQIEIKNNSTSQNVLIENMAVEFRPIMAKTSGGVST